MKSPRRSTALIILALLLLPLLWFAPQVFGGRTLIPADNLFTFEPWRSAAAQLGVGQPHNALISDLVLENTAWKSLIVDALRGGDPAGVLWNPRLFAGAPFLAAGQQSALYPLSVLFYILPLSLAYGVFTSLQLGLAALGMYLFARVLGQSRAAAVLAAVAFTFSGFMIVSVNFSMIIAAASWLPWLLLMIEMVVRSGAAPSAGRTTSPIPWVAGGALCLGLQALAGHVEITYYTLMVSGFYALWRLAATWWHRPANGGLWRNAGWLLALVALGLALGGVQLIPLYELVTQSFRAGSASLQQVRDWAWPSRQIITFVLPDFFGNPTHHSYFDIWARQWTPVTQNALGDPLTTIDWGVKNYVEGGNYLGIVTLLLAGVGVLGIRDWVLGKRKSPIPNPQSPIPNTQYLALFTTLAALSLLFAFGTPLYAVLYYGLPGYSQLHSAFRWVFPYTLSMALLAGFGLDALGARDWGLGTGGRVVRVLGWLATLGGAGALLTVLVSLFVPGPFVALGSRLLASSDLAQGRGFASGAMAWSYEAAGLARFGVMALLAGVLLVWRSRQQGNKETGKQVDKETRKQGDEATTTGHRVTVSPCHLVTLSLLALLVLDLWLFGHGFNTAADPKLLDFTPPAVQWLQAHRDAAQPWRLTSFDAPGEKTLNANSAMPYGLEDVRGYDSIIPRQYVAYMRRIQRQDDLLYNRIAPIYTMIDGKPNYDALDSPLLNLLGVRYIVTTHAIPNAGYTQVYDGEVQIYENRNALPRVFIVPQAVAATGSDAALDLLAGVNPAQTVVVEGLAPADIPPAASPQVREARISRRGNREVFVDVNLSDRGWLVFTDSYADGWKAYLRPYGGPGEGVLATGDSGEQQLPLYRADGVFRAVYLPQAGQYTVRFVYSPRSFLLGGYTSFLAGVVLLLLAGVWAWRRFYRGQGSEVGTVAKNSAVQVVMSLLNRGVDFAFAMLRMRILGPAGEGGYVNAINFYLLFDIISKFGLGMLLTRDVARDRAQAGRYLRNVIALRVVLWLLSLPLIAGLALAYRAGGQLTVEEGQAIAIFAAALFFANVADAISAVFNAFEQMEYPAALATVTTVAKVALGALVLLPPFSLGFVGLSGVSLVTNVAQAVWLYIMLRRVLPAAQTQGDAGGTRRAWFDFGLQRHLLRESAPLMLNHLLATVFWRISQFVLRGAATAAALGVFSVGVKFLDGLNVIPSYFTLAIFPLMSRYAQAGGEALLRAYRLAVQLLLIAALPVAVLVTFTATPLVRIVGGAAYLPDAATALAIMIWSIPIGFVNSVTQYTLIAAGQQRFLTWAFVIGVAVTGLANLVLVPRYGHIAAAAILIPAELSLFFPFTWAVRRYLGPLPWPSLIGRPLLATAANMAAVWGLLRLGLPTLAALAAGLALYAGVLTLLGTFRGEEYRVLWDLALRRRR